jgi:hypothetical protein
MTLRTQVEVALKAKFNPAEARDDHGRWTGERGEHGQGKYGKFVFGTGGLLMTRMGGPNAVRQKHWRPGGGVGKLRGGNRPPVPRGYWASPFGHSDPFLYFHRIEQTLPQKFQDSEFFGKLRDEIDAGRKTEADWDAENREYEAALKAATKRAKLSHFYIKGGFYSHIPPAYARVMYEQGHGKPWYFWESAREWAKEAKKYLWQNYRGTEGLIGGGPTGKPAKVVFRNRMDRQWFEIFVPGASEPKR